MNPEEQSGPAVRFTRRRLLRASLGFAGIAGLPILVEAESLSLEHHNLRLRNWTAGAVRLAVISDLHLTEPLHLDRALRACEMITPYEPDFLLLPGDFIEGNSESGLALLRSFLKRVTDFSFPTIAIFGNHDTVSPQTIWALREFEQAHVPLLLNEMLDFESVLFVGFEDGIHGFPRPALFGPDQAPRNVVALMHEPAWVKQMPSHFSLQISGHTHGGQICLPGGISLYQPRMSGGFVSGYYPNATIPMYVSRGIGTTGLPFRAYCRPEVTILDLNS